jgi:HlyD family secretion protein
MTDISSTSRPAPSPAQGTARHLALTIMLSLCLGGASSAHAQEAPAADIRAPSISTVQATRDMIVQSTLVTGTLVAREEIVVGVDVEGFKITEILVEEGDEVAAGDVLVRLDAATIDVQLAQNTSQLARSDAAIAQARAAIAQAEAAKIEADAALVRTRDLTDRGVTAQDALEQRVAAAAAASAQLNSAEQGLALALADKTLVEAQRREIELRLSKTEIKAPAAGIVLQRTARIGAVASAAAGPLFRLAEDGLIELQADVTETDLAALEPGMRVAVLPAGFSQAVDGEIRLVAPEIDRASRLGTVRVALDPSANLRVGSFARGTVELARSEGVTIPLSALVTTGGEARVQAVVDGRIETRIVVTGLRTADQIEIRSGLEPGETIVRRAGSFVRDGDQVTAVAFADGEM